MYLIFLSLMLCAGALVSSSLLKESGARVEKARRLFDDASSIEEGIRYKRAPVGSILGGAPLNELSNSGDDTVAKLISEICSSDYAAALNYAALLKNHTEKEMRKTEEKEMRSRPMMAYLPPAAASLAAILLL